MIVDLNGASGRDVLAGILKYGPCRSQFILNLASSREEVAEILAKTSPNVGIINAHSQDLVGDLAAHYPKVPVVTCIHPHAKKANRRPMTSYVEDDNRAIGHLAYEHFRSLNQFHSYAVVPASHPVWWSVERQREFVRCLKRERQTVAVYAGPANSADTSALSNFIARLPKPAAVFCTCDIRAQNVIEAAWQKHLNIPEDISILSVDDDELICELTRPKLSSIRADHIQLGLLMAKELHWRFRKGSAVRSRTIKCPPLDVTIRETSRRIDSAAIHLVQRAMRFIRQNASVRLHVSNVANHLGVSQRLLERRFAETGSRTVAAEIRRALMLTARQQLRENKGRVQDLARKLGFTNVGSFCTIFKRETGITPGQYRRGGGKNLSPKVRGFPPAYAPCFRGVCPHKVPFIPMRIKACRARQIHRERARS